MRPDFVGDHRKLNQETAELAESYQPHREQIMNLILATVKDLTGSADGECSSVTLLGPGNCLDIDLPGLGRHFREIHLVDVDVEAVNAAVERSQIAQQCRIHAPEDLAEPLLSLTTRDFRDDEDNHEHCVKVLQALTSEDGVPDVPPADVVVSLCVFSQIIKTFGSLVAANHPTFNSGLKALRMGHLRRMLSMIRPGGVAIFVSDVVSSDTSEELRTATQESLPPLVKKLVDNGNFFSGTNPALLLRDLNLLTRLPGGPESIHTIDPWPWHMGDRTYAVYAFRIQKTLPTRDVQTVNDEGDPENN